MGSYTGLISRSPFNIYTKLPGCIVIFAGWLLLLLPLLLSMISYFLIKS